MYRGCINIHGQSELVAIKTGKGKIGGRVGDRKKWACNVDKWKEMMFQRGLQKATNSQHTHLFIPLYPQPYSQLLIRRDYSKKYLSCFHSTIPM